MKSNAKAVAKTPNNSLVDLAIEAAEISQMLMLSQGELTPELEEKLAVNDQLLALKADSYNYIIEELEAQAALWKRRKDAFAAQQKKFEGQAERLRVRIKDAMKLMGKTEIRGSLYGFQLRKSAPKLVIDDESRLPENCKMIVQTTAIDKEKIKAALVDGFPVPGARLEESGSLYTIEVAGKE